MSAEFQRREVLIPMVGESGGAVARVAADAELPQAHPAQLDREISELLECGLYQSGQQAKAAVRSLRRSGAGLLGRPRAALSVVNPGDIVGLGSENSASAELGLALALLAFQSQSAAPAVIATGALEQGAGTTDVRIKPVHHIGQKFRVVAQHFSQPGSAKPPHWFLVPAADSDGEPIGTRYAAEVAALAARGIGLRPVGTLREAMQAIGAQRIAQRRIERRLRGGLMFAGFAVLAAAIGVYWLNSPLTLAFTSGPAPDGRIVMTPLRIIERDGRTRMQAPCMPSPGALPAFELNDQIGIRLRIVASDDDPTPWLGGYHFMAVVLTGERAPRAVVPREWDPEGRAQFVWDIVGSPDESTLIFLARRGFAFDADKLLADLLHSLAPLQASERESAAREFLRRSAPGVTTYRFKTVQPGSCS
jgi:hypothetical protein